MRESPTFATPIASPPSGSSTTAIAVTVVPMPARSGSSSDPL
jgi:hypothetical protein